MNIGAGFNILPPEMIANICLSIASFKKQIIHPRIIYPLFTVSHQFNDIVTEKIVPHIFEVCDFTSLKYKRADKLHFLKYIKTMHVYSCPIITDLILYISVNLRTLKLSGGNLKITYNCMRNLTNLRTLSLIRTSVCNNWALKNLTNLENLTLTHNTKITNEGVKHLTGLKCLNILGGNVISARRLTNLSFLFFNKDIVTDISLCTKLTCLQLRNNTTVTDDTISNLQSLKTLAMEGHSKITHYGLNALTSLTKLYIGGSQKDLDNSDLGQNLSLSNLTTLAVSNGGIVANFKAVTNITRLDIYCNVCIDDEVLSKYTNLCRVTMCKNNCRELDIVTLKLKGIIVNETLMCKSG